MARSYAPVYTSIWQDGAFTSLSSAGQRLYLLAISQPTINYCGVVPFTARRWARMAPDTTPKKVLAAVEELERAGFVVLDEETEELWVRSFVKHNKVTANPKLLTALEREYATVHSERVRVAFLTEYPDLRERLCDRQSDGGPIGDAFPPGEDHQDLDQEPSSSSADDDETDPLEGCWRLLAERKLREQRRSGLTVTHADSWKRKVIENDRAEMWVRAEALVSMYPQLTAQQLADRLAGDESVTRYMHRAGEAS